MPNTGNPTEVTQAVFDRLNLNKAQLGLVAVYYGDQEKVPEVPAATVEAGTTSSTLAGAGLNGVVNNVFRNFILIYNSRIGDTQLTKKEAELLAESVRDLLHTDVTFGGLVIHSFVTSIEPGYANRGGVLYRSARITWEGQSKTLIA